ncbi:MAG: c-type cytochrome domain-containing protein [Pirellulaceae bacterium]
MRASIADNPNFAVQLNSDRCIPYARVSTYEQSICSTQLASRRVLRERRRWLVGLAGHAWRCRVSKGHRAGIDGSRPWVARETLCRVPDGADADGQLDLSSSRGIQRGGEHGPVIVPGRPDESSLFTRVHGGQMPPEGEPRLAPEDVQVLADWIASGAELPSSNETIDAAQVMPILWLRCTPCHGGRRTEAGLDLRTLESIERGGESGPVVVSGNPAESRLVRRVHAGEMPPRRLLVSVSVKPMEDAELRKLEAWIAAGLPPARLPPDVATLEPDSIVSDSDREFWSIPATSTALHGDPHRWTRGGESHRRFSAQAARGTRNGILVAGGSSDVDAPGRD